MDMIVERPKTATPEIKDAAARKVIAQLIQGDHLQAAEEVAAVRDLVKMRPHDDGYEIAKELDSRHGWNCCIEMIEILDLYGTFVRDGIDAAQKAWVAENDIKPSHPIGTRVAFKSGRSDATGTITGEYEYGPAQYSVAIDGDPEAHTERQRRQIVNFEDVTLLVDAGALEDQAHHDCIDAAMGGA